MDRVLKAARLHTLRPLVTIGLSWAIVAAAFAVNVIVWRSTPDDEANAGSGAVVILAIVLAVTYVQVVTQLLPFTTSMGLSRRSFYLGTAVAAAAQTAVYALVLTLVAEVEKATAGWGLDLTFFAPAWIANENPLVQWSMFAAPLLAAAGLGNGLGIVFKRWGAPGMYVLTIGVLLLAGAALALIGSLDAWRQVGGWFADRSEVTLLVGLPLAFTLVVGTLSFAGLRRVVP